MIGPSGGLETSCRPSSVSTRLCTRRGTSPASTTRIRFGQSCEKKAFPFTNEMVQAMAVVLVHKGEPIMAVAVLLAFVGLFRLGEVLALRSQDFDAVAKDFCIVTLLQTKSRSGPVSVIVRDISFIALRSVLNLRISFFSARVWTNLI